MGPVHLRLDSRIRRRTWSKLKPSPIFLTIREADSGSFFPGAELQHAFHDPLRTRRLFLLLVVFRRTHSRWREYRTGHAPLCESRSSLSIDKPSSSSSSLPTLTVSTSPFVISPLDPDSDPRISLVGASDPLAQSVPSKAVLCLESELCWGRRTRGRSRSSRSRARDCFRSLHYLGRYIFRWFDSSPFLWNRYCSASSSDLCWSSSFELFPLLSF